MSDLLPLDHTFGWRGRRIAHTSAGSGPDLVFCHGTPWSSRLWAPYAAALTDRFTVHLWDMPGYGDSSKDPEHTVDLGTQGEALVALLDHLGLDRPHVVAHDFGGAVALRAALLHDRAYASLALVDVVALRPWGSAYFRLVAEHSEVFAAVPSAIHRGSLEAYIRGASHAGLTDAQLATLTRPWLDGEGQGAFYRQIAQADERFTAEFEERLGNLDVPVRVIWGREDIWIPPDRADRLAAAIPGADVRLIDGAGHLIQYDAPVALATELTGWLLGQTSLPGSGTAPS
jgi:pimeloyl-ACP methyl ester carboxylesterase